MLLTDFIFRQQENLVDNQKCQTGFRYSIVAWKIYKYSRKFAGINRNRKLI